MTFDFLASVTLKLNVTVATFVQFGRSDVFVFQCSPEKRTSSCPQRNLFSSETKITRNSHKHFAKELRRQRSEPVRQIINTTRDLKFVLEAEAAAADLSLYGNVGRARVYRGRPLMLSQAAAAWSLPTAGYLRLYSVNATNRTTSAVCRPSNRLLPGRSILR